MKKLVALVLCLMMAAAMIPAMAEGTLKTGLGVWTEVSGTDATENKDGQVLNEVTIAAVTLDEEGKIVDCKIDAYRAAITFDAKGELTQDAGTTFQTKMELGDAYGMGGIAPKGEWNQQADGFAAYCIGKTRDEIKGIAVSEEGKAEDEDILATTTISIGDFVEVVARAVEDAEDIGAKEGDTLYLVATANLASSKSATENKDGATQLDATFAAVTVNADNVITSIVIDAVQPKATITAEGKVTDVPDSVLSKLGKGENYGMQPVSSLEQGEWFQQIAGFNAYVTGKTVEEAAGIAMGEDHKATDADLLATTTIKIADFVELLAKIAK